MRLINAGHNSSPNRGIVEVLFDGVWGRVCSDQSWGIQDALVTCRQLGFRGAQSAYDIYSFAATEGIAWMKNVNCHGNESELSNCNFTIPPGNLCPLFGDHASVICSPLPRKHLHYFQYYFCHSGTQCTKTIFHCKTIGRMPEDIGLFR